MYAPILLQLRAQGWFCVDFFTRYGLGSPCWLSWHAADCGLTTPLCSIPVSNIVAAVVSSGADNASTLRLARLLRVARAARLFKLLRLLKLMRVMNKFGEHVRCDQRRQRRRSQPL